MKQFVADGRVLRGRRYFISAPGVGRRGKKQSTTAEKGGAVPKRERHRRWETDDVKAGAKELVVDNGPVAKNQHAWGGGDVLLCSHIVYGSRTRAS